ncbi:MAG TPA: HD domain-containing phosphohydrolase, partial [Candidatus Limnocylindria bacterium]|nr:HD domain-containing phosphohydrolase [Candidatus Limnocylindria bacterium]
TVIDSINQGEIHRFIAKPWLREELIVTIHNAVQRYELLRHNQELQAQTQAANQALAAQVTKIAEQNQQLEVLNSALHRNLDRSVQLCLKTMESYWPALSNQAHRVQELCRAMATTLDLPAEQRQVLDIAALLHDIGLIEVPREVIRKWRETPESLNDAELAQIKRHPVLGQELVSFVENLEDVGRTIRSHHERYDGCGYPDRLAGDSIPWLARLLAVAVVYSNFASGGGASEFIKANSSIAFDPEAVRVLLRALPHANLPRRQREVLLGELRPGMVLAHGIYSSSGLLLVPEGQSLNEPCIEKLRSHDQVSAIGSTLVVFG